MLLSVIIFSLVYDAILEKMDALNLKNPTPAPNCEYHHGWIQEQLQMFQRQEERGAKPDLLNLSP